MDLARTHGKRLAVSFLLAPATAIAALALSAAATASAATCPNFRVLHNDRIGPANLPAGNYEVTVEPGLSCQASTQLLALCFRIRFEDVLLRGTVTWIAPPE